MCGVYGNYTEVRVKVSVIVAIRVTFNSTCGYFNEGQSGVELIYQVILKIKR